MPKHLGMWLKSLVKALCWLGRSVEQERKSEPQAFPALGALRRQQIRSMRTAQVNAVSSSSWRSEASNSGAERVGFYLVLQKDEFSTWFHWVVFLSGMVLGTSLCKFPKCFHISCFLNLFLCAWNTETKWFLSDYLTRLYFQLSEKVWALYWSNWRKETYSLKTTQNKETEPVKVAANWTQGRLLEDISMAAQSSDTVCSQCLLIPKESLQPA